VRKQILILVLLASGLVASRYVYIYPCARPILYKVGSIDSKFGVQEDKLLKNLKSAEDVWEQPSNRNLFDFSSDAQLTVNFVYDSRQALKTNITKQEQSLTSQNRSLDAQINDYEKQVADFKNRSAQLNTEINDWNSKGGAPPEVYDQLISRQKALQQEADRLNQLAKSLNQKAQNYNSGVLKINNTISTFNQELSAKPEEGIYNSGTQTIDIFFITDKNELVHTLAHEFGHARDLDHLDDSRAIMYPMTSMIITATPGDLSSLEQVCARRSYWDVVANYLELLYNRFSE